MQIVTNAYMCKNNKKKKEESMVEELRVNKSLFNRDSRFSISTRIKQHINDFHETKIYDFMKVKMTF